MFVISAMALAARNTVPAAAATWDNVTGNLANFPSECGNLTLLSIVPSTGAVMAGVAAKGLWVNSAGTTWTQLGSGGGDAILNRPSWIAYDPVTPANFWESGIYGNNTGGIFKTTNAGSTFQRLGSTSSPINHNDYVSVDFSDPNRQLLLAGGHEQAQTVYRSVNGGQTWTNIGATIPPNTKHTTHPLVITSQTYVVNAQGWNAGAAGVFRTTNGGMSWDQVSTQGPTGPPLVTANKSIYWANGGTLLKSTDGGASWNTVGSGLQAVTPVELPDGRLVSIGGNTLVVSSNGGSTWTPIGPTLPYSPAGVVYSPTRKAFFIWHWDCGNVVLANAIMKLDMDMGGPSNPVPNAPTNLRIVR